MLELHLNLDSPIAVDSDSEVQAESDWGSITERIRCGDKEAFGPFYERFFTPMFQEAKRITNADESTCLDIVQDSMIKAIRSIKRIENEKVLLGWSRAVVKNSAIDWLRKKQRERRLLESMEEPTDLRTESDLMVQARIEWVEEQLVDLPDEIQKLFTLRFRFGWTLNRIAKNLGVKSGAVDGKLRRTIEKLKAKADLENSE